MKRYREAATRVFFAVLSSLFCVLFQYNSFDEVPWILFALTRSLIDIESLTGREKAAGEFSVWDTFETRRASAGACRADGSLSRSFQCSSHMGTPVVTLSTHMDTVPPFFPSSEDDEFIRGRGALRYEGIIAAMISAAENLLAAGTRNFGLLFVVGEEKDSLGALCAAKNPRGSKFVINGERRKTNWRLAQRRSPLRSYPRAAVLLTPRIPNSANPRLKNYSKCSRMFANFAARDSLFGKSTLNIGTISGGRAPNVIADEARADLMFRTVGDPEPIRAALRAAVDGRGELEEMLHTPALHLEAMDALRIPSLRTRQTFRTLQAHGAKPFLIGPGSIHVAHTAEGAHPKETTPKTRWNLHAHGSAATRGTR